MEGLKKRQEQARKVFRALDPLYGRRKTALRYQTPFQLLIATILSAQCTDRQVNGVTQTLFQQYKTPRDFLDAPIAELEAAIRPTGFFRNKARSIKGCAQGLMERHGGEVPSTMEDLVRLPGVGRKTANCVLGAAYDIAGVVVDTHVIRLSGRLGLTRNKAPEKIEKDIQDLLPKDHWRRFSDLLIYHGRAVCKARNPDHTRCDLFTFCPSNSL